MNNLFKAHLLSKLSNKKKLYMTNFSKIKTYIEYIYFLLFNKKYQITLTLLPIIVYFTSIMKIFIITYK